MKTLVVGAGIGGLTAALALRRQGMEVSVIERAPAFGEVGAGLQLSPNATRILFELGLEAPLRALAFAPQAVEVRDRTGATLLRTELGERAERRWGAPYLQLHRADLHGVLLQAAVSAGVGLHPGHAVDHIETEHGGVAIRSGDDRWSADALIGADGLHSRIRAAMQGETPSRYSGHVAWRALVDARRVPDGLVAPTATVWTSRGAHLVHYFVRGGRLINVVGFTPQREAPPESWTEPARPGEFSAAFRGWPPPVRALLTALEETGGSAWRSAIRDRPADPRWSRGAVALLGDAAHPMPPYFAQGAAMAIEDAAALARRLPGAADIPAALEAYAAERFPRTRQVQAWARRNGRVFHLPAPLRQAAFAVARSQGGGALDWLYSWRAE